MAKQICWGILGAGAIANAFADGVVRSETGRLTAIGSRTQEKAEVYESVANINRDIRAAQKEIALCKAIADTAPSMEQDIRHIETSKSKEEKQANKER